MSIDLGTRLRALREAKKYTQEYVAHQLKMTTNGYGKIERGESNTSYNRLVEIANVLETDIKMLLQNIPIDDDKPFLSPENSAESIKILKEKLMYLELENQFLHQTNQNLMTFNAQLFQMN